VAAGLCRIGLVPHPGFRAGGVDRGRRAPAVADSIAEREKIGKNMNYFFSLCSHFC